MADFPRSLRHCFSPGVAQAGFSRPRQAAVKFPGRVPARGTVCYQAQHEGTERGTEQVAEEAAEQVAAQACQVAAEAGGNRTGCAPERRNPRGPEL